MDTAGVHIVLFIMLTIYYVRLGCTSVVQWLERMMSSLKLQILARDVT